MSTSVLTPASLRDLVTAVSTEHGGALLDLVRFTSPRRWWTRLALTGEVELWLLSWLPGQHTAPHDHGGAAGAFAVVLGELSETYRYPDGPIGHRTHHTGSAIGSGAGRAHQVWNVGLAKAASGHAYGHSSQAPSGRCADGSLRKLRSRRRRWRRRGSTRACMTFPPRFHRHCPFDCPGRQRERTPAA